MGISASESHPILRYKVILKHFQKVWRVSNSQRIMETLIPGTSCILRVITKSLIETTFRYILSFLNEDISSDLDHKT